MMKIRACVGVLAVAACSFAVAADDAFLLVSAKVTSRDGQVLMNVSTANQDGSSLPLERGKEISYLAVRSFTDADGQVTLTPAKFKEGMTLELTPSVEQDGNGVIALTGSEVKFLGFQNVADMPGAQKPLYVTSKFTGEGEVKDGKADVPFGNCALRDGKPVQCEYTLSVTLKKA
ncbi:TPA: hypothetical protein NII19_005012 [Pseudomonas aeruginosa]|nr:hypothetical protein [Pseudomonas aeruginosa]HCF4747861.1 hypothetical protein [Pseudomonas aeruginosa]HCF4767498.1 hypothetical protein [Pseudomonas aeruginosa]HCF6282100.1 hypothetical protein [Pseudomonas aeruginosa]HCF6289974.1 hypothetical protein [Pseudomonas aeruginosa]